MIPSLQKLLQVRSHNFSLGWQVQPNKVLKHTISVCVPGNRQIALQKLRQTGVPFSKFNSEYAKFPSQILISIAYSEQLRWSQRGCS